jgi:hypothetical protein
MVLKSPLPTPASVEATGLVYAAVPSEVRTKCARKQEAAQSAGNDERRHPDGGRCSVTT